EWLELNLDRFTAWGFVLFTIAAEDCAPELRGQIVTENLTLDLLDLQNLPAAANAPASATRNPLAAEITSLKRQMKKLFPDSAALD
ncbi:MAG: hypothetical protein RLZZ350_1508, partial [Verrucomicrobiota bacterium]